MEIALSHFASEAQPAAQIERADQASPGRTRLDGSGDTAVLKVALLSTDSSLPIARPRIWDDPA